MHKKKGDLMADWRLVPNVRLKYLAMDKESGHVIVQKGDGSPLGIPYLVLLPVRPAVLPRGPSVNVCGCSGGPRSFGDGTFF